MAQVPPSEDVRPHRRPRQPRWMDDYEGYTLPQAVSYPPCTSAAPEEIDWRRSREGIAEMTPLTQRLLQPTYYPAEFIETPLSYTGAAAPVYVSTPRPCQGPPVMMDVLQQIQQENRRLQLMVTDMRRQMDRSGTAPTSSQPAQLHRPPIVPDRNIADDDWPLPPPPVAFPDDDYEPSRDQPRPLGPPADVVENLRERLQQLEARLSPAPSMLSEPKYNSVPPSVAPPQR
ncbi:uncharacterized protein AKAME5_002701400, partial [Lates japonicus]